MSEDNPAASGEKLIVIFSDFTDRSQKAGGEAKASAGSFYIIPINAEYYSDSVAIIPIIGYIII